jgi:hypothetical protein
MGFEIKGLDEFQRKLTDLGDRARQLDGDHEVPLSELLHRSFMSGCSRFGSLEEMFQASGFEVNSPDDFKAIPDDKWDVFIKNNTSFGSWREMLDAAVRGWTVKKLGL